MQKQETNEKEKEGSSAIDSQVTAPEGDEDRASVMIRLFFFQGRK